MYRNQWVETLGAAFLPFDVVIQIFLCPLNVGLLIAFVARAQQQHDGLADVRYAAFFTRNSTRMPA